MTPNEIHNKRFEKAMSGYRPEDVGAFLSEVANYVESLRDEKSELEQKIMVLAEKLEEYREDEDSLRAALISAQKLGDNVVRESKRKAEEIIEEANQKAKAMLDEATQKSELMVMDIKLNVERETDTLNKMQAEVARFKSQILSMYKQHIEMVKAIPYDDEDYDYTPKAGKEETKQAQAQEPLEEKEAVLVEEPSYPEQEQDYTAAEAEAKDELKQQNPNENGYVISFEDNIPESPFDIVRNEQLKKEEDEDLKEEYLRSESRHGPLFFGDKYTLTRKD